MSTLKLILRQMIVVICGLSCMGSVTELPMGAVATMMHGGHELAMVEHEGHRDLILRHQNVAQAETCAHHSTHLEAQPGHHHDSHIFHLTSGESSYLPSVTTTQVPVLTALIDCNSDFVILSQSFWPVAKFHSHPPPYRDCVMVCLRTTVLVV